MDDSSNVNLILGKLASQFSGNRNPHNRTNAEMANGDGVRPGIVRGDISGSAGHDAALHY